MEALTFKQAMARANKFLARSSLHASEFELSKILRQRTSDRSSLMFFPSVFENGDALGQKSIEAGKTPHLQIVDDKFEQYLEVALRYGKSSGKQKPKNATFTVRPPGIT